MLNWDKYHSNSSHLTEAERSEIRTACLADLHAQGARDYAVGVLVLLCGVDLMRMDSLCIHFMELDDRPYWALFYQNRALVIPENARAAIYEYMQTDARFEPYLLGEIPTKGAKIPLFLSDSNRTKGAPLVCARYIMGDALKRIGYMGKWLKWPMVAL